MSDAPQSPATPSDPLPGYLSLTVVAARWDSDARRFVRAQMSNGICEAVAADDPRLVGVTIEEGAKTPGRRVKSVRPAAFCTVLSAIPAPAGMPAEVQDADDAVTYMIQAMPKPVRIAWREKTRVERADILAVVASTPIPWSVQEIEDVFTAAASLPGSDAEMEDVPPEEASTLPEPTALQNALAVAAFEQPHLLMGKS